MASYLIKWIHCFPRFQYLALVFIGALFASRISKGVTAGRRSALSLIWNQKISLFLNIERNDKDSLLNYLISWFFFRHFQMVLLQVKSKLIETIGWKVANIATMNRFLQMMHLVPIEAMFFLSYVIANCALKRPDGFFLSTWERHGQKRMLSSDVPRQRNLRWCLEVTDVT